MKNGRLTILTICSLLGSMTLAYLFFGNPVPQSLQPFISINAEPHFNKCLFSTNFSTTWEEGTSYLISTNASIPNKTINKQQLKDHTTFVFIHINKAGGTSQKHYNTKIAQKNHWKIALATGPSQPKTQYPFYETARIIQGGVAMGVCDFIPDQRCVYFTMLRDPVQRAISEYNYFCVEGAEQREKWLEEWKANNECPLTITEWFGVGHHSMGSPRRLIQRLSKSAKKDICNIQIAKKNLLNGCVRYLLLEQYAEGLQKLQQTFGESFVDTNVELAAKKLDVAPPKRNSHPWTDRTMSQINSSDTMEVMRHLLRDDIAFYQFAVRNYELQWDKPLFSCN